MATQSHVSSVAVSDTAVNVASNLAALQALTAAGKLASVAVSDSAVDVAGNLAALQTLAAAGKLAPVAVSDSAADVASNLGALQTLAAEGKLASIALTDGGTPVLSVTAAQLTADATALSDLAGSYGLAVTGVSTASAAAVAAQAHVSSISVTDSAADVVGALDSLQTLAAAGKLSSIILTDGGIPALSVTAAQIVQDAQALNAITSAHTLSVPSVPAPVATFVVQQDSANRGGNGIPVDYPGTASSGGNSVIGFQSATFVSGFNAVVLNGPKSSYAIQVSASGGAIIKDIAAGDATYGQTVTVSGECYILFNGDNLSLGSPNSAAVLITPPGSTTPVLSYPNDIYFVLNHGDAQLAQFYSAMEPWEPQPGLAGFEYWVNQLHGGLPLTAIAQSFINTTDFQQTYGDPGTTHAQHLAYVELLYSHVLGMTLGPNEAGVQYWTGAMDAGMTGATTLISFTNAAATTATINAMSGVTAGGGVGWLIDSNLTGGYADPGVQVAAPTALAQAATNNFYNLSLIDPASVTAAGVSANGITLTPGQVVVGGTASPGTVVYLSPSFSQANVAGSGYTIHDGLGADSITVSGANNVVFLGTATTDSLALANGTNTAIAGFVPGHGSTLAVSGAVNETAVSLLNGTSTAVHGGNLAFGTASAATAILVNIGSIGDGSAPAVAAAANAAYLVAGVNGNAATGALGEHVTFIGTNNGGDAEIWAFHAPPTTVTVAGQSLQVPINGADLNGNQHVDANEITLIATLIGVPATALTTADLA